jgi:hypothetical protein
MAQGDAPPSELPHLAFLVLFIVRPDAAPTRCDSLRLPRAPASTLDSRLSTNLGLCWSYSLYAPDVALTRCDWLRLPRAPASTLDSRLSTNLGLCWSYSLYAPDAALDPLENRCDALGPTWTTWPASPPSATRHDLARLLPLDPRSSSLPLARESVAQPIQAASPAATLGFGLWNRVRSLNFFKCGISRE